MRNPFRCRPTPRPLPMSRFDHLVAGIILLREAEAQIEDTILDLTNALARFEESKVKLPSHVHRAEQLIMRLREVQAATR